MPENRAVPARQRFKPCRPSVAYIDDRLEHDRKLVFHIPLFEQVLDAGFNIDLLFVLRIEQNGIATPGFLGMVEGIVSPVEKLLERGGEVWKDRYSHGCGNMHRSLRHMVRRPQLLGDRIGICHELRIIRYDRRDNGKFVAAQSKRLAGLQIGGEALADIDQQPVSHGVSIKVVDRLEPVQIDDAQRQPGSVGPRLFELGFKVGEEGAAVGQFRQAVNIGKQQVFIAERFRALLGNDHALEIAVVGQQDGHHAGTDQQHVDGDGNKCRLPRRQKEGDEGAIDDDRHHESGRAHIHQTENAGNDGNRHIEGDVGSRIGIPIGHQQKRPERECHGDAGSQTIGTLKGCMRHLGCGIYTTRPPPEGDSQRAAEGEEAGNSNGEPERRHLHMRHGKRPCT
ncbi:hypothetical protein D3C87_1170820 [compost metagenome]